MPPGCALPPICAAVPPEAGAAECQPPFDGGAGPRAAPTWPVAECQVPGDEEPGLGDAPGVTGCHGAPPACVPVAGMVVF